MQINITIIFIYSKNPSRWLSCSWARYNVIYICLVRLDLLREKNKSDENSFASTLWQVRKAIPINKKLKCELPQDTTLTLNDRVQYIPISRSFLGGGGGDNQVGNKHSCNPGGKLGTGSTGNPRKEDAT